MSDDIDDDGNIPPSYVVLLMCYLFVLLLGTYALGVFTGFALCEPIPDYEQLTHELSKGVTSCGILDFLKVY